MLAYCVYWLDKRRAERGGRRISEKELLLWAFAGGSFGAFAAMRRLRHKTSKRSFKLAFGGVVALQLVLIWFAVRT